MSSSNAFFARWCYIFLNRPQTECATLAAVSFTRHKGPIHRHQNNGEGLRSSMDTRLPFFGPGPTRKEAAQDSQQDLLEPHACNARCTVQAERNRALLKVCRARELSEANLHSSLARLRLYHTANSLVSMKLSFSPA